MQLKFLKSGNPVNDPRPSVDVEPNRYAGFYLVIHGTTDVAQTLDEADIGRVRINRFGRQYMGETFEFFHHLSDMKGGFVARTVPTAGASRIGAVIPASLLGGTPNSWDVIDKEEMDVFLEFDATTLGTRFGANAATWELYGILAPGIPETYRLKIMEQDQIGSSGRLDKQLDARNVAALYLRDGSGVVDQVQVVVDGEVIVDNIDDETLLDATNINNRIEASGNNLIEIATGANAVELAYNAAVKTSVNFTGAGTLEVTIFAVETISPDLVAASQNRVRSLVRGKAAKENAAAKVLAPAGAISL